MKRTLFFYLTRSIALLIAFPMLSVFSESYTPQGIFNTAMRLSPLEQIGVVTVVFVIAAVLAELLTGIRKRLSGW
jgi:hypothetical protein